MGHYNYKEADRDQNDFNLEKTRSKVDVSKGRNSKDTEPGTNGR